MSFNTDDHFLVQRTGCAHAQKGTFCNREATMLQDVLPEGITDWVAGQLFGI